jgi:hypothetical protein
LHLGGAQGFQTKEGIRESVSPKISSRKPILPNSNQSLRVHVNGGEHFPKLVKLSNVVKGETIKSVDLGDPKIIFQGFMHQAFYFLFRAIK